MLTRKQKVSNTGFSQFINSFERNAETTGGLASLMLVSLHAWDLPASDSLDVTSLGLETSLRLE